MSNLFTAADTWSGGSYELAIELGARSDERLQKALETIWPHRDLDGCYAERDVEPAQQPRVPLNLETQLLGVATVPGGQQVACGIFIVCEEEGSDWIGFHLPIGALGTAYPFGSDASETCRSWKEPLDDWLVQMAASVFATVPFSLALMGVFAQRTQKV